MNNKGMKINILKIKVLECTKLSAIMVAIYSYSGEDKDNVLKFHKKNSSYFEISTTLF